MPSSHPPFKCDQTLCRNTYYNYGSYLRSRGYDKEICNLIMELQHGHIPISALKVDTDIGALQINGSVQINGTLTVAGNTILEGPSTQCKTLTVENQLLNPGIMSDGAAMGPGVFVDETGIYPSGTFLKSSEKYKSKISPLEMFQAKSILQIEPKTFEYNEKPGITRVGVIAEELDAAGLKEYVEYNDKEEPDGVHYQSLVPPLIQLVKDLTERVENLEAANALLLKNLQ